MMIDNSALRRMAITNFNRSGPLTLMKKKKAKKSKKTNLAPPRYTGDSMMIDNSALRRMAITNFNRSGPLTLMKKKEIPQLKNDLAPAPSPTVYRRLDDD